MNGTVPHWWLWLRRVVSFGLGVAVILDALLGDSPNVGKLVVGLVMIGVLPLDDLVRLIADRVGRRREDTQQ